VHLRQTSLHRNLDDLADHAAERFVDGDAAGATVLPPHPTPALAAEHYSKNGKSARNSDREQTS
jgi:hypothetical protein